MNAETADLTIEILYIKEIPFKVEYVNVPSAFPIDLMPYKLSPSSITVAGPKSEVERLGSWSLSEIDLHDIDLEYTHIFRIEMPEGFVNIDGVETVIWEFDPLSVEDVYKRQPSSYVASSDSVTEVCGAPPAPLPKGRAEVCMLSTVR